MNKFLIGKYNITESTSPFIIAELSANHNGKLSNLFKLIDEAKKAGANAIKIQSYTADSMTLNSKRKEFFLKNGLWKGSYLYDLYKKGSTPIDWHKKIFKYAKKKNILSFSTPFDSNSVKFLSKLDVPAFKIASFEITDIPLITEVSKTKKPIIISTGMASIKDIDLAVATAKKNGAKHISLLHCISSYPSNPKDYNLKFINKLIKRYNLIVGLSDHTLGCITAVSSVPLGARIIEKHIKLPGEKGVDSKFSMDTNEFGKYVNMIKQSFSTLGSENFDRNIIEGQSKLFRRSIFVSKDIKRGDIITNASVRVIRPAAGLHPMYYKSILGKKFNISKQKGSPLKLSDINFKGKPKLK